MKKWLLVCFPLFLVLVFVIGCAPAAPSTTSKPSSTPASATAAPVKTVELKVDIYSPPAVTGVRATQQFLAPEVERRTNGRVKLKVFHSEALGPSVQAFDRVASGAVDIAYVTTGLLPGKFQLTETTMLAFLTPDIMVAGAVFDRLASLGWFDEEMGPDVMYLWCEGSTSYDLFFPKKKVTTIDQLKGMKLRGPGGLRDTYLQELGAVMVKTAAPEMYQAAQSGVVEGIAFDTYGLQAYRLMEVIKYDLQINYLNGIALYVMNKKVFNSLPEDAQRIIRGMVIEHVVVKGELQLKDNKATLLEAVNKYGMEAYQISPAELTKLKTAMDKVSQNYINGLVSKGGDRVKKYFNDMKYVLSNYELDFPFSY